MTGISMFPLAGKVILLNSPAGAGKDTTANLLNNYTAVCRHSFKEGLINITCAIYSLHRGFWDSEYSHGAKDQPKSYLKGLTMREALIKVSETIIKPNYGKRWFGEMAAATMNENTFKQVGYVFSDSGFVEEIYPIAERFGAENLVLVRFTRPGHETFAGDSRNWVEPPKDLQRMWVIDTVNTPDDPLIMTNLIIDKVKEF